MAGLFSSLFKRKLTPEQAYEKGMACYDAGDYANAFTYFQTAAQEGHAQAQYRLAKLCADGLGTGMNSEEALRWYGCAARQGHDESREIIEHAAQHGNSGAQCDLGEIIEKGIGVKKSKIQAV